MKVKLNLAGRQEIIAHLVKHSTAMLVCFEALIILGLQHGVWEHISWVGSWARGVLGGQAEGVCPENFANCPDCPFYHGSPQDGCRGRDESLLQTIKKDIIWEFCFLLVLVHTSCEY